MVKPPESTFLAQICPMFQKPTWYYSLNILWLLLTAILPISYHDLHKSTLYPMVRGAILNASILTAIVIVPFLLL